MWEWEWETWARALTLGVMLSLRILGNLYGIWFSWLCLGLFGDEESGDFSIGII